MPVKTITYRQLCQYGASSYHARLLTQGLTPIGVQRKNYLYCLNDVVAVIRSYLERPCLKEQTRETLHTVLERLLQKLDNVIAAPFGLSPEEKISFYVPSDSRQQPPSKTSAVACRDRRGSFQATLGISNCFRALRTMPRS